MEIARDQSSPVVRSSRAEQMMNPTTPISTWTTFRFGAQPTAVPLEPPSTYPFQRRCAIATESGNIRTEVWDMSRPRHVRYII